MQFFFEKENKFSIELAERIARACEGLVYISEQDAPVAVFVGRPVEALDADSIRPVTDMQDDTRIEEVEFEKFFARLTKSAAWHGKAQRVQTKKFLELQKLLEENLHDLKVFKIGAIHVHIFAVGLDNTNNVIGITTEAVET